MLIFIGSAHNLHLFLIHIHIVAVKPAGLVPCGVEPGPGVVNGPVDRSPRAFLCLVGIFHPLFQFVLKGYVLRLKAWRINIGDIVQRHGLALPKIIKNFLRERHPITIYLRHNTSLLSHSIVSYKPYIFNSKFLAVN